MSILIKNMEIPKGCVCCSLSDDWQGTLRCYPLDKFVHASTVERADGCPLIGLPPHGDLIEKQAVLNILMWRNAAWDGYDNVMKLPTIIEAEQQP